MQSVDVFDLPKCETCHQVPGICACNDRLQQMFVKREEFMRAIKEKRGAYSDWPLDLSQKKSQQMVREVMLKGVEECFEALQEFRNWKSHRASGDPVVDRDKFLEEMVDALNFFFAALILSGINADDLFKMYVKKDEIIHQRLNSNY